MIIPYQRPHISHCNFAESLWSVRWWVLCICLFNETLPQSSQMTPRFSTSCLSLICWVIYDSKIIFLQCGHSLREWFAAKCSSSICCVAKLSTQKMCWHLNSFISCDCLIWRSRQFDDKKWVSHTLHLHVKVERLWEEKDWFCGCCKITGKFHWRKSFDEWIFSLHLLQKTFSLFSFAQVFPSLFRWFRIFRAALGHRASFPCLPNRNPNRPHCTVPFSPNQRRNLRMVFDQWHAYFQRKYKIHGKWTLSASIFDKRNHQLAPSEKSNNFISFLLRDHQTFHYLFYSETKS